MNRIYLKNRSLSAGSAAFLLASLTVARGSSFLLSKHLLGNMEPLNLLGIRFLMAFGLMFLIFFRRICECMAADRKILISAILLGGTYFLVMAAELYGLKYTTSSSCSFLENTAIVLVPVAECILLRRLPAPLIMCSSALSMAGIGFLVFPNSDGLRPGTGEILCMTASLLYTAAIILTDRLSKKHDSLVLGILYVGVTGILGLVVSFFTETPHLPHSGSEWMILAGLAVVCTCFGFTLQPVAQRHLTSELSGMICALNPLTAAILGWIILKEPFSIQGLTGAFMILTGILLPHLSKLRISYRKTEYPETAISVQGRRREI